MCVDRVRNWNSFHFLAEFNLEVYKGMPYPLESSNLNVWEQIKFLRTWVVLYALIVYIEWRLLGLLSYKYTIFDSSHDEVLLRGLSMWLIPLDTSHFGTVILNRATRNPVVWYGSFRWPRIYTTSL